MVHGAMVGMEGATRLTTDHLPGLLRHGMVWSRAPQGFGEEPVTLYKREGPPAPPGQQVGEQ